MYIISIYIFVYRKFINCACEWATSISRISCLLQLSKLFHARVVAVLEVCSERCLHKRHFFFLLRLLLSKGSGQQLADQPEHPKPQERFHGYQRPLPVLIPEELSPKSEHFQKTTRGFGKRPPHSKELWRQVVAGKCLPSCGLPFPVYPSGPHWHLDTRWKLAVSKPPKSGALFLWLLEADKQIEDLQD